MSDDDDERLKEAVARAVQELATAHRETGIIASDNVTEFDEDLLEATRGSWRFVPGTYVVASNGSGYSYSCLVDRPIG